MSGSTRERAVVVGNGIAGLTAADALREAGFDGELTIVGDEPYPAYSRPALSKALLRDGDGLASHALPPPGHGATELLGVRATRLRLDRRQVILDDGTDLPYDRLVLATGSRARRLSDLPEELTLRGLDDAMALRGRLAGRPSVVVIGGGPLGMEIASACLAAGCPVTLVSSGVPQTAQLGPYLAGVLAGAARARGLALVGSGPARIERREGSARVVLADGTVLEAEVLVSAVGDIPNTEWLADTGLTAKGAGLTADRGAVPVDPRGLVRPRVAAVGDLAALPTPYGLRRLPFWSSAIEQAKTAASALLRGDDTPPLRSRPYFWTEQFGLSLKMAGRQAPSGSPEFLDGEPGGGPSFMRWPCKDGTGTAAALDYRIALPRLRRAAGPGA
ncbi:NAD(P)/FAD-dependent oxidoreductase [Streptomyces sp. NBC_01218]|uniref:NAD(P)/FAD-dependent oxidoreductase n=1 Tax=unclassified Streptomyces TaxID=2593676 RepID=UPI0023B9A769|nr:MULTISPECIES: FAD/NAD(P)-binding oxidoreductase [unclassified Streptomyces]WEH39192.1 FAD/NAD(P)-binding oxidoreductase [Streptomyces sp. AM 2-1-1]WSQ50849.1 NAD(P)/FAD-dependent oxidoreductase [Streptomyces sp. NBC_01218]